MEKKTTQRIIGMLVVIALVIILLPLMFGKSDIITQASAVKVAPLPEQQDPNQESQKMAAAANASDDSQSIIIGADGTVQQGPFTQNEAKDAASNVQPVAVTASADDKTTSAIQSASNPPVENVVSAPLANPTPSASTDQSTVAVQALPNASTTNVDVSAKAPEEGNQDANPSLVKPQALAKDPNNMDAQTVSMTSENIVADAAPEAVIEKPVIKHKMAKAKAAKSKSMASNEKKHLMQLKSAAWAVQMGSFREKSNAVRLADKLRASGYKAFIRELKSSTSGNVSTRVYIGPEFKLTSVVKLSDKVAQDLNMRGYVVSYNPLSI